ncbi:hypothetical protein QBC34DRAFT_409664 [Podospora aff. communis PSN243]|uniref:Secreted protein n=1 Tax=Podospora aff. communis PSN243 TaxID=3040156 RepID=A0AAV9GJP0_9PEZI|nr:hypothetical protein QBC34DRAFT_409664 [Podospora aff. communis PSN243]
MTLLPPSRRVGAPMLFFTLFIAMAVCCPKPDDVAMQPACAGGRSHGAGSGSPLCHWGADLTSVDIHACSAVTW